MANITPYRQNGLDVKQELKPRYGLIRVPKPIRPHHCNLDRPASYNVVVGSLFRCSCGKVSKTTHHYEYEWNSADEEDWKRAGGKEKKYGLIHGHQCSPPNVWQRLWLRLSLRPIYAGSLFRCPECKKIKEWDNKHGWNGGSGLEEEWKKLGGE